MDRLENKKKEGKKVMITKCPLCGGEVLEKKVDVLCREGMDAVMVTVKAWVCSHCGERLYPAEAVELFDRVRRKLRERDFRGLVNVGAIYKTEEENRVESAP